MNPLPPADPRMGGFRVALRVSRRRFAMAGGVSQTTGIECPGDTVSISPDARERFRALDAEALPRLSYLTEKR